MRPIAWYLLFVGLPLAALFGILKIGARLVPPRAVHGRYSVTVDSSGNNPCLVALLSDREWTVSQSGPRLDIRLAAVTLAGVLVGDSIRAAAPFRAPGCLTSGTLRVLASLDTSASLILAGHLLFEGCSSCLPAPFRATRAPDPSRTGGA